MDSDKIHTDLSLSNVCRTGLLHSNRPSENNWIAATFSDGLSNLMF
ncbi:hypothetical protein [Neisseria montereyensis]|uniref:Uncharacterized protein n=1 Tax=Neisseria montereyensis TaxID=2973938 RepID=A0ABT2FBD6_9NEIS|nr:hypothetical protein [Neisseria montereyensis]MCS4533410.1 hypothetical protein [Neisseria montereyensis]